MDFGQGILSALAVGQTSTLPPITKTLPPDVKTKQDGKTPDYGGYSDIDNKIIGIFKGAQESVSEAVKPLPDTLNTIGSNLLVNLLLGVALIVLVGVGLTGVSASDLASIAGSKVRAKSSGGETTGEGE